MTAPRAWFRGLWPFGGQDELRTFQKRLGYEFRDQKLLRLALTHRSYAHERNLSQQNERLEFLGDSVLGLITGEELYHRHPSLPEGQLSRRKSYLVSEPTLAQMAAGLQLSRVVLLGVGEDRSGGRDKSSILADSLEAVLGAVFLDGGLQASRIVLRPLLNRQMEATRDWDHRDHKTRLQELLQSRDGIPPHYVLVGEDGPDHAKIFTVECRRSRQALGRGSGSNKKAAEQEAAAAALTALKALDPSPGPP